MSGMHAMSATVMLAVLALLAFVGLLCNSGAWLWIGARWLRVAGLSYRRALLTAFLWGIANLIVYSAFEMAGHSKSPTWLKFLLFLLSLFVVGAACVRTVLRTSTWRAVGLWLFTTVLSSAAALPVVIALRMFVMESFIVPSGGMAPAIIGRHYDVRCPECGFGFAVSATGRENFRHVDLQVARCPNCRGEQSLPQDFPAAAGDRVLVDKLGPRSRWGLIAHRYPEQIDVSYLFRLVGFPGETVEIIGGDVFINGRRERKPYSVAPEMWEVVNDSRFVPPKVKPEVPQWLPLIEESRWRRVDGGWQFSGPKADEEPLRFSGTLTDETYYGDRWGHAGEFEPYQPLPTGDLRITCTLRQFSGDGHVEFRWRFQGSNVRATIAADGAVALETDEEAKRGRLPKALGNTTELVFAVRDGYATIGAGGDEIAGVPVGPEEADACRRLAEKTPEACRLELAAARCDMQLSSIVIERDVYYAELDQCSGCRGHAITLGPGEHFVLGDHSQRSNDSRMWQTVDPALAGRWQPGAVPGELIIGVVRCIYWPPERWREFR